MGDGAWKHAFSLTWSQNDGIAPPRRLRFRGVTTSVAAKLQAGQSRNNVISIPILYGCVLSCLLGCATLSDAATPDPVTLPPPAARPVDFVREIKPLFEASCIQCHAKGKDKGGFSLETREALLKGADDGPVAAPGQSGQSMIVKMVAGVDPDNVMPKKGKKWTREQVGLLRAWIDQGMAWDATVTFARPAPLNFQPRAVELPAGPQLHPVDRILSAYFAKQGIALPAVVEDRIFARRVYLDVIGLLPTPAQLDDFLGDRSPDKRAGLARQLLADRRGYADHWLTFWNDLLRNDYRGTGFTDGGRRQISAWLFAALIENKPYDRFVAELVNPNKASEGFSRGIIWRGTVNASQLPPLQAAQTISQVFMGVNLKCASCHDSFVSDWTLADAYGLAAVYSDDALELVHCDKPTGKIASPRFLYSQLGALPAGTSRPQRLAALARLITDRKDGRLSRTIVNRLWARLLGRGLVESVDDMEKPAWSADLLDWLAEDLVAHHYDLKHTIEVILTSAAYQLPAVETPDGTTQFIFHGPQVRRLTAEQFCDALATFGQAWPRLPASLQFDFSAGNMLSVKKPAWIWTNEPLELGQSRAIAHHDRQLALQLASEETADSIAALDGEQVKEAKQTAEEIARRKKELEPPKRHRVGFIKVFELDQLPQEAYAIFGASQSASLWVNGALAGPTENEGRVGMYDLKSRLRIGFNRIVIDISSHTEKGLNDTEREKYPASRNHVNKISGVAFYLREKFGGKVTEITTDSTWQARRAPEGGWRKVTYDASEWGQATELPDGITPVDEGPSLPPIQRKDFANEAVEVGPAFWRAATTIAQPGGIRASMLASDALMAALDRPNREQVMTVRSTAATTLQALALTNGSSLDARLKSISEHLAPGAAKDPAGFIRKMYRHALSRDPSDAELRLALEVVGMPARPQGVADFLWALTLSPEFQFIE